MIFFFLGAAAFHPTRMYRFFIMIFTDNLSPFSKHPWRQMLTCNYRDWYYPLGAATGGGSSIVACLVKIVKHKLFLQSFYF